MTVIVRACGGNFTIFADSQKFVVFGIRFEPQLQEISQRSNALEISQMSKATFKFTFVVCGKVS